jgi:predicted dehydrogenase|tara:strand:- start:14608 stop:15483 length:876 start_codon:yes stop_codon:yes gene_type:complete
MKSLIVGMGIGQLYMKVLTEMGIDVVTVDPNRPADFKTIQDVPIDMYDTVHICTPNETHEELARFIAPWCHLMFIEKPGLSTSKAWADLHYDFPECRISMVKNNQFRHNIDELINMARTSRVVDIHWQNKNRVPNPGSWFTTKELAYGGVSRDLLPHLLSLYQVFNPSYANTLPSDKIAKTNWDLKGLLDTDYGTVDPDGVYDVDDEAGMGYKTKFCQYNLLANWKTDLYDDVGINFEILGHIERVELGLCPEEAYKRMIDIGLENLHNNEYWEDQFTKDMWIHKQMEELC